MIMEADGMHYIFMGIANNINTAKAWESDLKGTGMRCLGEGNFT